MNDTTVLDQIDRSGFSRQQRKQLTEVKTYFGYLCRLERKHPSADYSKFYLTFCYNLLALGLKTHAQLMLAHVKADFYENGLEREMRRAYRFHVEYLKLKENPDPLTLQRAHACRAEAEFFIVALGVIGYLSELTYFPGIEKFRLFLEKFNPENLDKESQQTA